MYCPTTRSKLCNAVRGTVIQAYYLPEALRRLTIQYVFHVDVLYSSESSRHISHSHSPDLPISDPAPANPHVVHGVDDTNPRLGIKNRASKDRCLSTEASRVLHTLLQHEAQPMHPDLRLYKI